MLRIEDMSTKIAGYKVKVNFNLLLEILIYCNLLDLQSFFAIYLSIFLIL